MGRIVSKYYFLYTYLPIMRTDDKYTVGTSSNKQIAFRNAQYIDLYKDLVPHLHQSILRLRYLQRCTYLQPQFLSKYPIVALPKKVQQ